MTKNRILQLIFLSGVILIIGFKVSQSEISKIIKKKDGHKQVSTDFMTGDIMFQTTSSDQCKAVQIATHSIYSHCGLVYKDGDKLYVIEAVQPVKVTPMEKWIAQGLGKHYVCKRLKNADKVLTSDALERIKVNADQFIGKNYDIYFNWSDESIYCSELVWKIYQRSTGIEIGKLQELREFDLTNDLVKKILKERYGDNIPLNEKVISPAGLFESDLLTLISEN